jgi:hypothetical protein
MPKRKTENELEMWAADLLMEAHAITPCPDHGYMRLRHSHHAVDYAVTGSTPNILEQKQKGADRGGRERARWAE